MATVTSAGRATDFDPLERVDATLAAEALYERHGSRVFGYCLARLRRRDEAEDAAQTTFLHALRGLRRGVVPAIESAWLLGIARNVCLSRWEERGRRTRVETPWDPHDLDRGNAAPQRREELAGLDAALALLPEQQRHAVVLRDWRGLSYDEIADRLDVSRASVEALIFRGRRRLGELIREEPAAARRRFSLAGFGSLLTSVKSAFSGGAAAVKVAVAVIAVSGAGVAVGTSGDTRSPDLPLTPSGQVARAPEIPPADMTIAGVARNTAAPAARGNRRRAVKPKPAAAPAALGSPAPRAVAPGVPQPSGPRATGAETGAPPAPGASAPTSERGVPAPVSAAAARALEPLPAATTPVTNVLPELPVEPPQLPELPISLPELPISLPQLPHLPVPPSVEPLTDAVAALVPPVAVDPVTLPVPPLQIDLPLPLPLP